MKRLLVLLFVLLFSVNSFAKVRIFLIQSYSKNDLCGVPQLKGFLNEMRYYGYNDNNTVYKIVFLKTKTVNITKKQQRAIADKIYKEILNFKPNIVVLFDDPAFRLFARRLLGKPFYVVFSGMNVLPSVYNKKLHFMKNRIPTANIVGVYEKLHIAESVEFMQKILGNGKIAVVSSKDLIGRIVKNQIIYELKQAHLSNLLVFFDVDSVNELKRALERINKDKSIVAYILNTHSLSFNGRRIDIFHIIPIAIKIARKPDIAINAAFAKAGLFGGVALDFKAMGRQAADLVIRLLGGENIHKLKIEDAQKALLVINLKRAKQLNIKLPISVLNALDEAY